MFLHIFSFIRERRPFLQLDISDFQPGSVLIMGVYFSRSSVGSKYFTNGIVMFISSYNRNFINCTKYIKFGKCGFCQNSDILKPYLLRNSIKRTDTAGSSLLRHPYSLPNLRSISVQLCPLLFQQQRDLRRHM